MQNIIPGQLYMPMAATRLTTTNCLDEIDSPTHFLDVEEIKAIR
jgi:hypothetical protein